MQLNKDWMKDRKDYPERIIQFGHGNFLRGFADWIVDQMNQEADFASSLVVIGARNTSKIEGLNQQDGLYTLLTKGIEGGKLVDESQLVASISRALNIVEDYEDYIQLAQSPQLRFMISNTTEAGIAYDPADQLEDKEKNTFPAKLASFLYQRYRFFEGDPDKGLIHLPCELIEANGDRLKEIILTYAKDWALEEGFSKWIEEDNSFCNTLVDRIVPGPPKRDLEKIQTQLGYEDRYMVEVEPFYFWAIQGDDRVKREFPIDAMQGRIIFTEDLTPYRTRKVRILNGAHTAMVAVGYLYGLESVGQVMDHPQLGPYVESLISEEIIASLDSQSQELKDFAQDCLDRFRNPYAHHLLMSISLNSISKFATRLLPSIRDYQERYGKAPSKICFSLAALIYFYRGRRGDEPILLKDDPQYLDFFQEIWSREMELGPGGIVEAVLGLEEAWGQDLNKLEGLKAEVEKHLSRILEKGIKEGLKELMQ